MRRVRERCGRRLERTHRAFVWQKKKLSTNLEQMLERLVLEHEETYRRPSSRLSPESNICFYGA